MRFEGNSRGINRSDYQQFTDFLGLSQPRYSKNIPQATMETHQTGNRPAGMIYGVKQYFVSIYDPEIALENGTIFEELNKPFYQAGCSKKSREGCL